jgi:hypothetical protein
VNAVWKDTGSENRQLDTSQSWSND